MKSSKMKIIQILLILQVYKKTQQFNIDTNNPIVYEDPSKYLFKNQSNLNYFGYSVILYPGSRSLKPWLLIGAPKGTDSTQKNKGTCFKCGIAENCEFFDIDGVSKSLDYEKLDGAWLGASMDINYSSERVVTCAPRWIRIKQRNGKLSDYHMQGACYWFHTEDNSTQKLLPLFENRDVYTHPGGGSVYNYAQGQSGFSVHLPPAENEMVLGAPGVYNWAGTSLLYKDNIEMSPVASRLQNRASRFVDGNEFNSKIIADAINTKETYSFDILGYSTTSGYFYNQKKLSYVSSAPRSDYFGKVFVYKFGGNSQQPLQVHESKSGHQFGEYFGASVTAGDLNGDGLDDLVVGAPFYNHLKYNEGKIYIFLGSLGHLREPKSNFVIGKAPNGQFGSTVQFLGDINHDNFGDLAVSAPYEDSNSGTLYIYRGTKNGLEPKYSQRISGKSIHSSIRGFGSSISRAVDMDSNKFSDIAVGAYLSGHVTLLRSRPVITIFQELKSSLSHLEVHTNGFVIQECYWFKLDEKDPGEISYIYLYRIQRNLTVDQHLGRAILQDDSSRIISLNFRSKVCYNSSIRLTKSSSNRYNPISINLVHTFLIKWENKNVLYIDGGQPLGIDQDRFCPRCPVYNSYDSISSTTIEVPFALGCKSGNICKASLEIDARILYLEDETFILGSENYLTLQIDVKNFGEKAYQTDISVTLPEIITFRSTPSACTETKSSVVVCSVDNPLDTNSKKSVVLDLDMTAVNSGKFDSSLIFTVEAKTSSENDGDRIKKVEMKLRREADVTISGKSTEQSYSYRNLTHGKPEFSQTYQVEKFGSSPLNEIEVEIEIPHMFKTSDKTIQFVEVFPPFATLGDQPVICKSNFSYVAEKNDVFDDTYSENLEEDNSTIPKKIKKRQVEVFNKTNEPRARSVKENEFEAFQNRTFYINCSMEEVVCSKIICSGGPLKSRELMNIRLKMRFDITSINGYLGKKDVILLGTRGRVFVINPKNFIQTGDRPDFVDVASLFIGESQKEKVALWIIIISAIAGLLLLSLLIFALIKAGFFKRTTKEELEQLKKEIELNENLKQTQE